MWVKFHRDTLAASSDHMKECLTLSEVHTAINQYKNKKPLGRAGVTNEMLTHVGNSAIRELLNIYNHSWSFRTLSHICREAIIIQISFDKRHTWKPIAAKARMNLRVRKYSRREYRENSTLRSFVVSFSQLFYQNFIRLVCFFPAFDTNFSNQGVRMKIALVYINPWGGDGGLHHLANCFICYIVIIILTIVLCYMILLNVYILP